MDLETFEVNQMSRALQSICGVNPFTHHNSASRIQMNGSHMGQKLVIKGATEQMISTGMDKEFGKYTLSVDMPCDGIITKRVNKYTVGGFGAESIKRNPETILFYEREDDKKEIGVISLPTHSSFHPYLGFEYVATNVLKMMKIGDRIEEGTKLLDSPAVGINGEYRYGITLNTAYMSHPAVTDDGVVICRDVLPRLAFKKYERRTVEWGRKRFPINLYGDDKTYKIFPDIGDMIRPDGALICLRDQVAGLSPVQMSTKATQVINSYFDKVIYADGAGGRVVDVNVSINCDFTPGSSPMEQQLEKYVSESSKFYKEILAYYNEVKHRRGRDPNISPEFQVLMRQALYATETERGHKVTKQYCNTPIDDFRVEFVIEYEVIPDLGFKLTDLSGGKGVICYIAEPHEMPVDADGNRADIIMDSYSRPNRMNMGGLIEHYIGGASRDTRKRICTKLGIELGDKYAKQKIEDIYYNRRETFDSVWAYLKRYYYISAPKMFEWDEADEEKIERLATIVSDNLYLYAPAKYARELLPVIDALEAEYPQTHSCVTYKGYSGKTVTTERKVRIAPTYWLLLEKIADDGSAVASGKFQLFGVPAQPSKTDKYALPWNPKPVKFAGETELRLIVSYSGVYLAAEFIDMNNSPKTHMHIVDRIFKEKQPTNITRLVNRNEIPYNGSKSLQLFNHMTTCAGIKMTYRGVNTWSS